MNSTAATHSFSFLEGGGEMADLISSHNWSKSALGSIPYWPHSLQNTLDTLLHTGFPMFLFWGKDLHCFYNDAFRALIGNEGRHPMALGAPGETVWPESWHLLKPMIDEARKGGRSPLYEDVSMPIFRNSKLEEAYWTFSYHGIRNEEGDVEGILFIGTETTQKVRMQAQADEAGRQMHFAFESTGLGTWELDPATMIFSCNRKTREIFGLAQNENMELDEALRLIHPDDAPRVKKSIAQALDPTSRGGYDIEYRICDESGIHEKTVRARGKAYFNTAMQPIRFSGTLQDISLEKKLDRRNEKLQQLVENSKDFMSMADLHGYMTYMNVAGRQMLGIPAFFDISQLRTRQFYSEEQFALVQSEIIPALVNHGHWSGFIKIKHQETGEEIPCDADYLVIKDPVTGAPISRALSMRDLRPELVARKELEDSEKRFRNLVQEAPVATAIYTGKEMTIQWANDAMIKLWGRDRSVIGKTVREALPELEGQPFHGLLEQVYATGIMYQATEDRGDLMVDDELRTFYFNYSYKPLRDTEGKIYGILNMAIDVTDSVKTKRKLEESERNFRQLIMQAPVGICILSGSDYVVDLANDQYLAIVGRQREGFVQKRLWDVLPEAKEQGFDKLLDAVRATARPYIGYEHEVELSRNGRQEIVYINFVYEPLLDEEGKVHSILVVAIDISQQVEARKKVEHAEERARLAVASARLGTYEVNMLTNEVIASARFNELFDVEVNAPHAKFVARLHPDDLPARQKAHELSLVTGQLEYECRINRRDGTTHWLQIFGRLYFENGIPHRIVGIAQDITDQKLASEEREKFLSLSHYSRDFIGMCDMNMKTVYVNKAGIDMLGIDADRVQDASLWDCFFPEDHNYLRDAFFPAVLDKGHGEVEIRFRHFYTGAAIWVIYSVFIIRDSKGQPSMMATVSRDITERKNMQSELERRVKERTLELVKLNDELQQFTYVSSHDLKEPLRKIRFFASIAESEAGSGNERLSSSLAKITAAAGRMSNLLTDLLNYSMLSKTEQRLEPVDLNKVLKNIEEDSELSVREKNAVITIGKLPVVSGIPFQLTQLFFNLVSNALKFNRPGIPPEVMVRASGLEEGERHLFPALTSGQRYHKIEVIDNGIGFRQEYAQKIFVVFQRLNTRKDYSGNGIGLSLCKKIVENHHGEIFASSEPDKGAVFTVILPVGNV